MMAKVHSLNINKVSIKLQKIYIFYLILRQDKRKEDSASEIVFIMENRCSLVSKGVSISVSRFLLVYFFFKIICARRGGAHL